MHLFKRLLLTKFPNSTIHNIVNPASMFIGFISAKEFFSIINRKIIENYRLNLFDVNLDPVEFKMWFWEEKSQSDQKDLDTYFAYCVAANLNGNLFFSPANLGNAMSLLASVYFKEAMVDFPHYYFNQLIYTVYLLTFTFASRVKVFPSENDQENYNWFVDVFFDFFKNTFEQLQTKISDEEFLAVKKEILQETAFCFLLFHFYKRLNGLFKKEANDKDYLDWLFGKTQVWDTTLSAFKSNYETTKYLPHSSPLEQKILNRVWPVDILIKYVFWDSDPILAVDTIIEKIFDKNEWNPIVESFLKSDKELSRVMQNLLWYKKYKYGFFAWLQNYMIRLLRQSWKEDILEDLDEMLSAIDNWDDISNFDIPERIKKESKVTERLLNYYITLLWWFTTARWDSFYLRCFKPEILEYFKKETSIQELLSKPIYKEYYEDILCLYSNVLYYYVYIDHHIRTWKTRFQMPAKSSFVDVSLNVMIVNLYLEWMIASYFQDLNPKDTKLTVKNTQIINKFKALFWKQVQEILKWDNKKFLVDFYATWMWCLKNWSKLIKVVQSSMTDTDLVTLRDSLYKLDYWVAESFMNKIKDLNLKNTIDDSLILSLYGTIRETLFWFVLLYAYLNKEEKKIIRDKAPMLILLYAKDILLSDIFWVWEQVYDALYQTVMELQPLLELWCWLDDNVQFFELFVKNWKSYISKKRVDTLYKDLSIDDIVWFRGLLKNITYYNKRFVIPW